MDFNKKNIEHRVLRSAVVGLLVLMGLFLFFKPVFASGEEVYDFSGYESAVGLVDPVSIYGSSGGQLAVWDNMLQEIKLFSSETGSDSVLEGDKNWLDFFQKYTRGDFARRWSLALDINGFWDDQERFWYYDRPAANHEQKFTVSEANGEKQVVLEGPVDSIIPVGSHWIIQNDTGIFSRWDPDSKRGLVDTFSIDVAGKLLAVSSDKHYFSLENETIYVYENGDVLNKRKISDLIAVDYYDGFVYVLREKGSISRLNKQLGLEFTFDFLDVPELVDFVVHNRSAYLVGPDGFFQAPLDESDRSFFSSSAVIGLHKIGPSGGELVDKPDKISRVWVGDSLYLFCENETINRVVNSDTPANSRLRQVEEDEVPLIVFQYFQSENTFWDNEKLYYYFPGEKAVEAYDAGGHVLKQVELSLADARDIEKVKFLGASDDFVLLCGEMIYPGQGYTPVVIKFNWQGQLERIFKLDHPAGNKRFSSGEDYPKFRFDGQNSIYLLFEDHVQIFDLGGYPRQVIGDLNKPTDLMRFEDHIFIITSGGQQLIRRRHPGRIDMRFATPPDDLAVFDAITVDDDRILFVGDDDSDRSIIYEYDRHSGQYRRALRHPVRDLDYLFLSEDKEKLFFRGKTEDSDGLLYSSDLQRYSASSTGHKAVARGAGNYIEDKDLFIVPTQSDDDPDDIFYQYFSEEDEGVLRDSQQLVEIVPGGFAGYYATRREDTGTFILSGYLDQEHDTAPWSWQEVEKIKFIDGQLTQLMSGDEKLYIAKEDDNWTELFELDISDRENPELELKMRGYGSLRWVKPGREEAIVLQKQDGHWGRLVLVYFGSYQPGGISGRLQAEDPLDLEGIELMVQPGGQLVHTGSGGSFSFDEVGPGYVEVSPTSYEYHFPRPYDLFVPEGAFNVDRRPVLYPRETLFLLERGRQNFKEGSYRRARIAFEAFRRLAAGGPYYDWGTGMLKEIYWREENIEGLQELFQEVPDYFSPEETYRLYRLSRDEQLNIELLNRVSTYHDSYKNELIDYHISFLKETADPDSQTVLPPPPLFVNEITLEKLQIE